MNNNNIENLKEKASAFFQRGEEVASTENFDYAIDLYLEGIKRDPDALESGHAPLRRISLIRQSRGGKKPTVVDKFRHKAGKSAVDELINAEYLLAKDPDNLHYAVDVLNACFKGGFLRTAVWIARLIFSACKATEKPPIAILQNLKEKFTAMEIYEPAVACCDMVLKQKPDDHYWRTELKNLSASATIQNGKYDKAEKFSDSVQDNEQQRRVRKKDSSIRDEDYRQVVYEDALKKYENAPDVFANRIEYARALSEMKTPETKEKACEMLADWFEQTDDFGYKRLHNEIIIKKLKDSVKAIRTEIETQGSNEQRVARLRTALKRLTDFEIEHYSECIKEYPTEHKFRFELGLRLMHRNNFDGAIPCFQQAAKKPSLKIRAMNLLGMCFFNKGWYSDAIDVFESAIKLHSDEDEVFKELRYNLARACELDGRTERALTVYRKLAQLDYEYRDVASRVNKLRDF